MCYCCLVGETLQQIPKGTIMGKTAYEIVAQTIVEQLSNGVAPWRSPWVASGYVPKSLSSKKKYNGTNHWLLSFVAEKQGFQSPWWGTFRQITEMGGGVRKGEKGAPIVLYSQFESENADGEKRTATVMRYFTVFNAEQAEWPEGKTPKYEVLSARPDAEIIGDAQKIVDSYINREKLTLTLAGDRAFYSPSKDAITVPKMEQFHETAEFYSTLFHEMGHSTGHATRLKREGVVENHYFGSELYSQEELVAEFTSAFLSSETGIAPATLENSASYIHSWYKVLKNDPKMLVNGIAKAQKATDFILGVTGE
jgi:antirestriction protein ArdC